MGFSLYGILAFFCTVGCKGAAHFLVLNLSRLKLRKHLLESVKFFAVGAGGVEGACGFVIGFSWGGLCVDGANIVLKPCIGFRRRSCSKIFVLFELCILIGDGHGFNWFALLSRTYIRK